MAVATIQDMFLSELQDLYHAEKQLLRALPKMVRAASAPELKRAFESHLEETRGQVERLEQVFQHLDRRSRGKRCEAMEGLVEEAKEQIEEIEDPDILDCALIIAAQKVEHYEIAGYGSLHALAAGLGHKEVAKLLAETLAEEKSADEKLNKLAVESINKKAMQKAA